MAFKAMVKNTFVQQLIEFVRAIETSRGEFTLAMLVPSESGLTDKWNLVVSAKWIDDKDLLGAIPILTSEFLKHLSKSNAGKIERVSPLSTKDSFIREIVEEVEVVPGTAYRAYLFALTTRGINDAIILAARNLVPSTNRQPQAAQLRR